MPKWVNKHPYGWHYEGHGFGTFWVKKSGHKNGRWYAFTEEFGGKPIGLGNFATRPEAQAFIESHVQGLADYKAAYDARNRNPMKKRRAKKATPAQLRARALFAKRAKAGAFSRYKRKARAGQRALNKKRDAEMRRVGYGVNRPSKKQLAARRSNPAGGEFQIAGLRNGKVLYLSGVTMTDNRKAAGTFRELWIARTVAKSVRKVGHKLGISKVAIVTSHDSPEAVRSFLLGKP